MPLWVNFTHQKCPFSGQNPALFSGCGKHYGWYIHISKKKEKFRQVPQIKFSMHAVRRFMLEFIEIVFSSCKPMKRRHSYAIMFCVLSPLSCAQTTACYPSLKTTTTRGLIVGFFDLKHMSVNHYPVLLSAADILLAVLDPAPPPHTPKRLWQTNF